MAFTNGLYWLCYSSAVLLFHWSVTVAVCGFGSLSGSKDQWRRSLPLATLKVLSFSPYTEKKERLKCVFFSLLRFLPCKLLDTFCNHRGRHRMVGSISTFFSLRSVKSVILKNMTFRCFSAALNNAHKESSWGHFLEVNKRTSASRKWSWCSKSRNVGASK